MHKTHIFEQKIIPTKIITDLPTIFLEDRYRKQTFLGLRLCGECVETSHDAMQILGCIMLITLQMIT